MSLVIKVGDDSSDTRILCSGEVSLAARFANMKMTMIYEDIGDTCTVDALRCRFCRVGFELFSPSRQNCVRPATGGGVQLGRATFFFTFRMITR